MIKGAFPLPHKLEGAMDYEAFVRASKDQYTKDPEKEIEGSLAYYTGLNLTRMARLDKTVKLLPELSKCMEAQDDSLLLLCIVESWCGDVAHVLPVLNKMVEQSSGSALKMLARDTHPDLMNLYLTNDKKAIPIVLGLKMKAGVWKECFKWGPNPKPILELKHQNKIQHLFENEHQLHEAVQKWYNQDKSVTIQQELLHLLKNNQ